ncbi:hypothetical protein L0222_26115 [bacterium]|nr:hypothetical protein [bacterium]
MYARFERIRLFISIADFYGASWYEMDWPHPGKEKAARERLRKYKELTEGKNNAD